MPAPTPLSETEIQAQAAPGVRRRELQVFLFLTVVLFPLLSVLLVSGFGFAVWIWQMIFGPPGS
ncbi:periplasmic nitrate reductase, NapE protein [Luteimonas sp. SJ-92]|uniref:Periplasmic nitrate reductase, NapE protein n=1 Tax=Luteimonas salinisoli TaxID=2752307 RepID=A0A853J8T2_9GAMM|nr:periplasmic nitrate reductase, NapE protein [Luteimonas salinisoli]NZA25543.1 periplasmic nitrate reductase, NapE protein [Luteimonas salinisoli]